MRALALALPLALVASVAAAAPVPVVAVFDIEDQTGTLEPKDREQLAAYLTAQVAEGGRFRVVPRAQLRTALAAQKQDSYRECFDEACQIEVGKELAAEKSLLTQVLRIGDQCVVSSTLYDLRSSATEQSANQRGSCAVSALLEALEVVVARVKAPREDELEKAAAEKAAAERAAAERAAAEKAAAEKAAAEKAAAEKAAAEKAAVEKAAVEKAAAEKAAAGNGARPPAPAAEVPGAAPLRRHAFRLGGGVLLEGGDGQPRGAASFGYAFRFTPGFALSTSIETVASTTGRAVLSDGFRLVELGLEAELLEAGAFSILADFAPGLMLAGGDLSSSVRLGAIVRWRLGGFFVDATLGGLLVLSDIGVGTKFVTSRLALGYAF
jgi:hypothetical protein